MIRKEEVKSLIEDLKDSYLIGYACIISPGKARAKNYKIENNKATAELKEKIIQKFSDNFMNPDVVRVDVLTGSGRKRRMLDEIIDTFRNGDNRLYSPKGTLVIFDLNALGTTNKTISDNFKRLLLEDIGLLILDKQHERFSTVDYGGQTLENIDTNQLLSQINNVEITTKQGRKKQEKIFSDEWKELYWLYENYFIKESSVYENSLIQKTTRVTFGRYCDDYEQSLEYEEDEKTEDERYNISSKPKRHGAVPEYFNELMKDIENGIDLQEACKKYQIPLMTPITYKRYAIKAETGRSGMGKASRQYYNEKKNDEIQQSKKL